MDNKTKEIEFLGYDDFEKIGSLSRVGVEKVR